METLDYTTDKVNSAKTWPTWDQMKKGEFKVVFRLPWKIEQLATDEEFSVKLHDGDWYFKLPGEHRVY